MKIRSTLKKTAMIALLIGISWWNALAQQNPVHDYRTLTGIEFETPKKGHPDYSNPSIYRDGSATITEMMDEYLFPRGIDPTGKYVMIQTFGTAEESFFWSAESGIVTIPGKGTDITANLLVAGDFMNNNFPGGGSASTAGVYSMNTEAWTFLGINPEFPTLTADSYNSAWGQSDDGSVVVGLQLYNGWSAVAFKWSETDGYTNIGSDLQYDSRASGVSRNGEVIFGWVSTANGFWTPIIWHDNTHTLLSPNGSGEALCASAEGTYVGGHMDDNAFLWSLADGFQTFGSYDDYPTCVLDDGTVFGFTGVFPPDMRRAFYRTTDGEMGTFNDYAEARGMENAQDWTFYSVNNVTADGNKFIGAGINPNGQSVCFLIDFSEPAQTWSLNLVSNPEEGGSVTGEGDFLAGSEVTISAVANPVWAFENWTDSNGTIISDQAETTIIMPNENYTLYANFKSTVGVNNLNSQNFEIYPNPAKQKVNLNNSQGGILNVFSMDGQLILKVQVNKNYVLDISSLDLGVYLLTLETPDSTRKARLIKN